MTTDEKLFKDVTDRLNFEPGLDNRNIIVGVKDGVVTLTGTVDSYMDKWKATRIVKNIKGVLAVVDELKVKLLDPSKRTDTEIAQTAVNTLKWNVLVPHEDIKIEVNDGFVTLSGEVQWNYQKEEAEKAIRRLTGVKGITNLITLAKKVLPSDVKQQILNEFKRNVEVDANNIEIEVNGSEVILKGKVHSWQEIKEATRAAWSVPGVTMVTNRLVISPD